MYGKYDTKSTSNKSKSQSIRFTKIRNICAFKDTIKKMKRLTEWVDVFANHISEEV